MPDDLRKLAEAAHDGLPWGWPLDAWLRDAHASEAEAAFARAASPQAVLALLDERDRLRNDLDRLTELSALLRKELDGHGAHLDKLQQENDQLVRDLEARIADDKKEVKALRAERDRLRAALREIQQHARDGHAQTAAARLKTVSLMARNALEGDASES